MSREDYEMGRLTTPGYDTSNDETVAILAVRSGAEWREGGNRLQADGRVAFSSLEEVSEESLARLCPTVILSPVLARNFDCIDLAQKTL